MQTNHAVGFVALAETGDPTLPALRCGVAPSALLRAVQRLEVAVDGLLLSRRRGKPRLTPLGQAWLPHLIAIARNAGQATVMPQRHRADDRTALAQHRPALARSA